MAETWRSPLRNHIDRLKRIRDDLRTPFAFYTAHEEAYVALARSAAETVLLLGERPPDMEPEQWAAHAREIAALVGSKLVNGEEVGLIIFLDGRMFEQVQFENIAQGTFAKDTVLNWVRAGRAEDPLGKQFDERDLRDSDQTIAARVWWAMYTGRSRNSAEHIRQFLAGQSRAAALKHLPAILAYWQQTIAPVARKDWRQFVRSVISKP